MSLLHLIDFRSFLLGACLVWLVLQLWRPVSVWAAGRVVSWYWRTQIQPTDPEAYNLRSVFLAHYGDWGKGWPQHKIDKTALMLWFASEQFSVLLPPALLRVVRPDIAGLLLPHASRHIQALLARTPMQPIDIQDE